MRLRQVALLLWYAGTALVVASWVGAVSPLVGWGGFAVSLVGGLITWIPTRVDPTILPLTQEGFPVEPSGTPVPPDMPLEPGTPLLAQSQGQWWRAVVVSVEPGDEVIVTYPGWNAEWMERLPRTALQVDPDPNRKPIVVSPELLDLWNQQPASEHVRPSQGKDGIQE